MVSIIHQKVMFSTARRLTTRPRSSRKVGSRFTAFGGMLRGQTLMIVPDHLIVQSWRASSWKKNDPDSVLILQFDRVKNGGRITFLQANVPQHAYRNIKEGWPKHYWTAWKTYLKNRRSR